MQGIIIVWLLACSLPAIHHALDNVSESTNSLCEQNLQQDDAMEILEPSFTKFEDWGRAFCLTNSTMEKLVAQDLNSRMFLMMLTESDVDTLGLTVGQKRILMVVVEKLQEAEAREAAQREQSRKNQFSVSHDTALRRQKREGSFSSGLVGSVAMGLVGVGAVFTAPLLLTAAGFTSAGIAAGSLGASMMSSAAIANGGAVAAGSTVAVLQSIGAAGIPAAVEAAVVVSGAAVGAGAGYLGYDEEEDF
uniref:SAM domain-containing protein n=1 Tax=Scylla olivacea TaxID=85551 RepID=A0A0P4WK45_SCYOL